jgi:hypothetical protein
MSAQPERPSGEKAPRPIVINDGSDGSAPAPGPQAAPEQAPQQAAPGPQDPQIVVELATIEAMLARERRGDAVRMLTLALVAGGAFVLASAAYYRTARLMSEGEAE